MSAPNLHQNNRILVIDDNEAIHADFRKIFAASTSGNELDALENELFGGAASPSAPEPEFTIDSAMQGQQGFELVRKAKNEGRPYSVAFVDVRMPPGWDGIETSLQLWVADPNIQVVICTAYSDYSWEQTLERLGRGDRFLILKKPFDTAEVRQLAHSLSTKWALARQSHDLVHDLEQRVLARTLELTQLNAQLVLEMSAKERIQLELVRSQKLESLGQLVAGIAHEINNPLGFILSNLRFLEEELQRGAPQGSENAAEMSEVLKETSGGAERIRRIVRDLKVFCRTDEGGPEPIDVHQVIESAINIVSSDAAKSGSIAFERGDVPRVLANGSRLGQVFLNLFINAIQALPANRRDKNIVTVKTSSIGAEVEIEVRDNGSGIDPAIIGKVFDPFFTTKPIGQGTGLGLSICHGIVSAFGGSIKVESTLNVGTVFRVRLPAVMAVAARAQAESSLQLA